MFKLKSYLLRIFVLVRLDRTRGREPVMQQKGISLKENIQLTAFGFGLLIVGFNLFFGSINSTTY